MLEQQKVYIDGQHGTTGLRIKEMVLAHPYLDLVEIPYELRHDPIARQKRMNEVDIIILCLPDDGSREAMTFIGNSSALVIDTSTAFRCDEEWVYGLPELSECQRQKIMASNRIANPGCHATAAILLIRPLIQEKLISEEAVLSLVSVTGYTGGGRKMIETYEKTGHKSPVFYSLSLAHKHLPEMMTYTGLKAKPYFMPIIGGHPRGIAIALPLQDLAPLETLNTADKLDEAFFENLYKTYYGESPFYTWLGQLEGKWDTDASDFSNQFKIGLAGNDEQPVLVIQCDNLGKGASGAVIQTINMKCHYPLMTAL